MAKQRDGTSRDAAPRSRAARWRAGLLIALGSVVGLLAAAGLIDAPITRALTGWPAVERDFFSEYTRWGESDRVLVPALVIWGIAALATRARIGFAARWAFRSVAAMSGFVFAAVGLAGLATVVLKRLIGRARPVHLDDFGTLSFRPFDILDSTAHSFPSGHATTAFALAVALVALFGRRWSVIYALAVLMALSRIVTGQHYFTDTLAGAAVGTGGAILVRDWFERRNWVFAIRNGRLRNRMLAPVRRYIARLRRHRLAR